MLKRAGGMSPGVTILTAPMNHEYNWAVSAEVAAVDLSDNPDRSAARSGDSWGWLGSGCCGGHACLVFDSLGAMFMQQDRYYG
ncbi:MAG: hypothetical protein DRJ50_08020 [Actinobacteria bacterium]|nr:MAG: hypothetical protein DRJ50_08020 [Actinomycetota bacterium]